MQWKQRNQWREKTRGLESDNPIGNERKRDNKPKKQEPKMERQREKASKPLIVHPLSVLKDFPNIPNHPEQSHEVSLANRFFLADARAAGSKLEAPSPAPPT